ncbi:unnamed protein product [Protopolystoma xenopodis]|uniref:Uncharacterized protein n=1 Tax=Protopolystoma xenopodis TaxID=117903 RepID=A0A3S5FGC8_9PLAT|nr:unnamed protein product [Protopolystoma xenopodis]
MHCIGCRQLLDCDFLPGGAEHLRRRLPDGFQVDLESTEAVYRLAKQKVESTDTGEYDCRFRSEPTGGDGNNSGKCIVRRLFVRPDTDVALYVSQNSRLTYVQVSQQSWPLVYEGHGFLLTHLDNVIIYCSGSHPHEAYSFTLTASWAECSASGQQIQTHWLHSRRLVLGPRRLHASIQLILVEFPPLPRLTDLAGHFVCVNCSLDESTTTTATAIERLEPDSNAAEKYHGLSYQLRLPVIDWSKRRLRVEPVKGRDGRVEAVQPGGRLRCTARLGPSNWPPVSTVWERLQPELGDDMSPDELLINKEFNFSALVPEAPGPLEVSLDASELVVPTNEAFRGYSFLYRCRLVVPFSISLDGTEDEIPAVKAHLTVAMCRSARVNLLLQNGICWNTVYEGYFARFVAAFMRRLILSLPDYQKTARVGLFIGAPESLISIEETASHRMQLRTPLLVNHKISRNELVTRIFRTSDYANCAGSRLYQMKADQLDRLAESVSTNNNSAGRTIVILFSQGDEEQHEVLLRKSKSLRNRGFRVRKLIDLSRHTS